ncbi:MAG: sigma-70 family RNA polymerase sigma factor [Planctomycetia bacterium]|nr:sigma-70 family RNA polymerase sigma factor [Planctomycetia bacterium]
MVARDFADFLQRVRAGDVRAAEELVRKYEPAIRREVRMRLHDPRLCRLFDSMDICQSVLASFFVRAAAGQYDLDTPQALIGLLLQMARNKLASKARQVYRRPADQRRVEVTDAAELDVMSGGDDPLQLVVGRDLLCEVLNRLTEDERRVSELRGEGRTWPEIAQTLGGTPGGRRKQLARALDRVAEDLGLDRET